MKFQTKNEPLSIFAYSSMTDIVMLLLIFFLLSSHFVMQTGVKVKLPGSKTNEQTDQSRMIVTLTSAGGIYVGNEETGIDQLPAKLSSMKGTSVDDNLIIRADRVVAVELVIKVIDAAKGSGIEKFTLETEREKL